jgi:hypothetical protein
MLELSHACGVVHPALVGADRIELIDEHYQSWSVREAFGYETGHGGLTDEQAAELAAIMQP